MFTLLEYLFHGHAHKWEIIDQRPLTVKTMTGKNTGMRYYVQCKVCGTVKKKDLA